MKARLTSGIELEYEEFGDPSAPPLVLIMGLGTQMIAWPDPLCESLAAAGLRVIRFDNRDVGLSTRLDGVRVPGVVKLQCARWMGRRPAVPYTLEDMAQDAAHLLDALEIPAAHVAGASMGGMIAQVLAINHPQRVRSLCSIMSTTGAGGLPGPRAKVAWHMFLSRPKPGDHAAYIQHTVQTLRMIGSPGFPQTEDDWRALVERHVARAYYPEGFRRQLAAVLVSPDRSPALEKLTAPTLVIHGSEDPLIRPEAGRQTAAVIPGARLEMIEGMGHDMAPDLLPTLSDLMAGHALSGAASRH
ncbi:MAG: alpha/beta fold hydrolase [Pseudomonadota bacterium]